MTEQIEPVEPSEKIVSSADFFASTKKFVEMLDRGIKLILMNAKNDVYLTITPISSKE